MAASLSATFTEKTLEHLSTVWIELTFALLAAIAYFIISKSKPGSKREKKNTPSGNIVNGTEKAGSSEPSTAQLAYRAVKEGRVAEAVGFVQQLPETVKGSVPNNLAMRLLSAATEMQKPSEMRSVFRPLKGKIKAGPLETVVTEAVKNKDVLACRRLHMISNQLNIPKNEQTFEAFARAYSADAAALRTLTEEVGAPLPKAFATIVLEASAAMNEMNLAKEVLAKVSSSDVKILRSLVAATSGTAKDNALSDSMTTTDSSSRSDSSLSESPWESLSVVTESCRDAAPQTVSKEIAQRSNDIRSCGRNGDLKGAIKVFDRLGDQSNHTMVLNSIVDACVECKNIEKASEYFDRARRQELADVFSYNTMIKGYILNGQESLAKPLLAEISEKGLGPNRVSFHALLNARVNDSDFPGAWKIVGQMQAAGLCPNAVTCSILLKNKMTPASEVQRVLLLIDAMTEPMDEVLFLTVVEACIRTGRLDALSRQMSKFMQLSASASLTAPTYGSMIKAFGHARDVNRVWQIWEQMTAHKVLPTSVTLGCMVEALVANGCTNDAWKLTQKMWNEEDTRPLVNTVIYSSILKGFANAQDTKKVLALYEDMKLRKIQPNTITFNTILNAFAKGGTMHRVPALLDDMAAATPPVEPDIVSYSTIVKGYCNSGNLDRAIKVVNDMKARGKHIPDEVMYNSLLGGCAKEHRPDQALEILNDMRKFGVAPSNYTLSMLVKLMGRCRRISQAFTVLEDISKEYDLKVNIQVYTCLIQGCFNGGLSDKAIALYDKIMAEGLYPDSMTYTVLVRGCLQAGLTEQAMRFAKCAYGREPGQSQKGSPPGLNAVCRDELLAALDGKDHEQERALLQAWSGCGGGHQSRQHVGATKRAATSWD